MRIFVLTLSPLFIISCKSYEFYSSTQKISHPFNNQDSIYVISPFVRYNLVGDGYRVLDEDSLKEKSIERFSNEYLLHIFRSRFKSNRFSIEERERDSIRFKFERMTKRFFYRKENNHTLNINSKRSGYLLIFESDWQLWDEIFWHRNLYHGGGRWSSGWLDPRLNISNYFCLIDLRTGRVVDYEYLHQALDPKGPRYTKVSSHPIMPRSFIRDGNVLVDEDEIKEFTQQSVDLISKHLLSK
jgi:hypothetical protein